MPGGGCIGSGGDGELSMVTARRRALLMLAIFPDYGADVLTAGPADEAPGATGP